MSLVLKAQVATLDEGTGSEKDADISSEIVLMKRCSPSNGMANGSSEQHFFKLGYMKRIVNPAQLLRKLKLCKPSTILPLVRLLLVLIVIRSAILLPLVLGRWKGLKRQKEAKTIKNQQETGKRQRVKSKSEKSARDHSRISPTQSKKETMKSKTQDKVKRAKNDKCSKFQGLI
ncbi:hypothetical protein Tco_1018704 [Tanacetum coccineum]|uniref:Uncharacterized protein n=1 Tax=Tanacetum coccineum TaxID=301880 RepID=A0ABQ5FVE6_9ASTR